MKDTFSFILLGLVSLSIPILGLVLALYFIIKSRREDDKNAEYYWEAYKICFLLSGLSLVVNNLGNLMNVIAG